MRSLSYRRSRLKVSACALGIVTFISIGQTARASEDNENFRNLREQVNTNTTNIQNNADAINYNATGIARNAAAIAAIPSAASFDYRDFSTASNITSKTFTLTGSSFCGNRAVRTYNRAVNGSDTIVTMTRTWDNNGTVCEISDFIYLATPTNRLMLSRKAYLPDGTLNVTYDLDKPIILATSSMTRGVAISDASRITQTFVLSGSPTAYSAFFQTGAIEALEDVTVPAGTFTGCLKKSVLRNSSGFGANYTIEWRCPGVGEVRRIQVPTILSAGDTGRVWELQSITYAAP